MSERFTNAALVLLAVSVFSLLLLAAAYVLTVFEPQPNRSWARKGFRWAAVGAFVGGAVGAVIDLAFGLQENHFAAWGMTVGPLIGAIRARTRWSLPPVDR